MITLMCFDIKTKDELIKNGYNFLFEKEIDGRNAYVFLNNGKSLNFDSKKIVVSNKMMF